MRTHLSGSPIATLSPRRVEAPRFKPVGLWWGVDDSWCEWMSVEQPDWLEASSHLYEVILDPSLNMLELRSPCDLDDFTSEYGKKDRYGSMEIRWPVVMAEYDAIEISPYQWSRRLEVAWYYGWDCASGCAWRTDGITLVERPALLKQWKTGVTI